MAARKVAAGLADSIGSLLPGLCIHYPQADCLETSSSCVPYAWLPLPLMQCNAPFHFYCPAYNKNGTVRHYSVNKR